MPDTVLPTVAYSAHRVPADLAFILSFMLRTKGLTHHQALVERLRGELAWATEDWQRLNPHWRGWAHEAVLAATAQRMPHEDAAAEALNCWGHVIGHKDRIRACLTRLAAQRNAGWHAHAIATADDLRAHWKNRRACWRVFLDALRRYRALRAEVDRSPSGPACAREAA